MTVAHRLSLELRSAEDRIRELEAEVERLEGRATRAEQWLGAIKKEIEDKLIAPMEANRSQPQMLKLAPALGCWCGGTDWEGRPVSGMRRREFITLLGGAAAAWPLAARAQQPAKVPRIGFLFYGSPGPSPELDAFRQGLRELGYIEGQNIVIEYRFASGRVERLPELATELVRLKPDVIVTPGTPASLAAKQATSTIPIVFAGVADAVGAGLVANIARPGGNITGLTSISAELGGKRLELLKGIVPNGFPRGGPL